MNYRSFLSSFPRKRHRPAALEQGVPIASSSVVGAALARLRFATRAARFWGLGRLPQSDLELALMLEAARVRALKGEMS